MPYQPLTKEQFMAARGAGFSPEKITQMELLRKQKSTPPPGQYDVVAPQPPKVDHKAILSRLKQEAPAFQQQAKSKNSILGLAGSAAKEFGSTMASSEIGLGKSIGAIGATGYATDLANKATTETADMNIKLARQIAENERMGKDTTRLKQLFNQRQQEAGQNTAIPELPSTGEVVGQIGGTALDLLTAGTYGKAAQGMKTGSLAVQGAPSAFVAKTGVPSAVLPKAAPSVISAVSGVVPPLGKVGEIASKTPGLFTKGGAAAVGKGAGIGYGFDVAQGLQGQRGEERTGAAALIPGLGTVIGGGLPAVTGLAASVQNKFTRAGKEATATRVVQKRKEILKTSETKSVSNYAEKQMKRGFDPRGDIADTDLLVGAVDGNGKVNTKQPGGAVEQYNQAITKEERGAVAKAIQLEGKSIPLVDSTPTQKSLRDRMIEAVNKSNMRGASKKNALAHVDSEIEGLKLDSPDGINIPIHDVHIAKVDKYENVNYMNEGGRLDKLIAKALKKTVEDETTSTLAKKLNREMSRHYTNIGYLEKIDGMRVEGGRMGKHFARTVGAIAGVPFGPLGPIVGAEAAGAIKGSQFQRTFGQNVGRPRPQASAAMKKQVRLNRAEAKAQKQNFTYVPVSQSANKAGSLSAAQSTKITKKTTPIKRSIAPKAPETYMQQGKRELKQAGKAVVGYAKNPKLGMSIDDVSKSNPLLGEARKYKTAEEFWKADHELPLDSLTMNTPYKQWLKEPGGGKPSLTPNKPITVIMDDGKFLIADGVHRYFEHLNKGAKTIKVQYSKSQLTDIWKQAQGGKGKPMLPNKQGGFIGARTAQTIAGATAGAVGGAQVKDEEGKTSLKNVLLGAGAGAIAGASGKSLLTGGSREARMIPVSKIKISGTPLAAMAKRKAEVLGLKPGRRIVSPIQLRQNSDGSFTAIGGTKRLAQAFINEQTNIPAVVTNGKNLKQYDIANFAERGAGTVKQEGLYVPPEMKPSYTGVTPISRPLVPRTKAGKPQARATKILDIESAKDLPPHMREIETRAIEKVLKNEDQILSDYFKKYEKTVNVDNFRQFFKDVGYTDGSLSAAVQEPASYLGKRATDMALRNKGHYVLGMAGGSGTGKTTAAKTIYGMKKMMDDSAMILDSNFSKYDSARNFIEKARDAGKKFKGVYTYRDFMDSVENGIISRMLHNAEEMGRIVPSKVAVGNHADSWDVVKRLVDEGEQFSFIDNSLGENLAKEVSLNDMIKKIKYPPHEQMLKEANALIKKLYEEKKPFVNKKTGEVKFITREQYERLIQ
jgi:hypothetical protein